MSYPARAEGLVNSTMSPCLISWQKWVSNSENHFRITILSVQEIAAKIYIPMENIKCVQSYWYNLLALFVLVWTQYLYLIDNEYETIYDSTIVLAKPPIWFWFQTADRSTRWIYLRMTRSIRYLPTLCYLDPDSRSIACRSHQLAIKWMRPHN